MRDDCWNLAWRTGTQSTSVLASIRIGLRREPWVFKRSGIGTGKGQGIGMATMRFKDAEPGEWCCRDSGC